MSFKGGIIIFSVLCAYFGMHVLIYLFISHFFSVEKRTVKLVLGASLLILSLSFIFAAIVMRFTDLFFFKMLYAMASFWMGYVIILLLTFSLGWVFFLVFRFAEFDLKLAIGICSILASFIYASWGVWSALHPVLKEINITINNLPLSWENKKVVQISDVHLGKINGKRFAMKLVESINSVEPDIILITGDLFDGMGSNVEDFLPIIEGLNAKQGIYFVTGNHEGYLGSAAVLEKLKKTKIKVLENELVEIDGVQLIGLSYPEFTDSQDKENILEEVDGLDSNKPNILLYHVPVNIRQEKKDRSTQQSQAYWKPDTDYSLAKDAGINLQLSGHTHAGQFFPFTWVGKKIFNGFNYGLITDGDFNLYISSGVGTWGPPIRTSSKSEIVKINLLKK